MTTRELEVEDDAEWEAGSGSTSPTKMTGTRTSWVLAEREDVAQRDDDGAFGEETGASPGETAFGDCFSFRGDGDFDGVELVWWSTSAVYGGAAPGSGSVFD